MREAIVRELWCYPVKSCQGVLVDSLQITKRGVIGDRMFAIWEEGGKFVEQKDTPKTASIAAQLLTDDGILELSHETYGVYRHEVRAQGALLPTQWVLDKFETVDQGDEVADWLSQILDKKVRLVAPGESWSIDFPHPQMTRVHGKDKNQFFAASEVSIANQASLDDLNARVDVRIPMDRFRANVVVDGIGPYEEDEMDIVVSGDVELLLVTPAERCLIISTDQKTGERPKNNVLKVLSDTRRRADAEKYGSGLLFGNYMTVEREGTLTLGDSLSFD